GNTYTYGRLKNVSSAYLVPKPKHITKRDVAKELHLPGHDPRPRAPASAGLQLSTTTSATKLKPRPKAGRAVSVRKQRLFANPHRPAAYKAGGRNQILARSPVATFAKYFAGVYGLKRSQVKLKPLKKGSRVIAGTILGRIGVTEQRMAPHVLFEV